MNGLKNPKSRKDILEAIYKEICNDTVLKAYIQKKIGSADVHYSISQILSKQPKIVILIDELNKEVEEACESLKYEIEFVEFKTFVREDAVLFEGLRVQFQIFTLIYLNRITLTMKKSIMLFMPRNEDTTV